MLKSVIYWTPLTHIIFFLYLCRHFIIWLPLVRWIKIEQPKANFWLAWTVFFYFSSETIHYDKFHTQAHKNGIFPTLMWPWLQLLWVLTCVFFPLPPEFLTPQDGHDKHDSAELLPADGLKPMPTNVPPLTPSIHRHVRKLLIHSHQND